VVVARSEAHARQPRRRARVVGAPHVVPAPVAPVPERARPPPAPNERTAALGDGPPVEAIEAFGAAGRPARIDGGQGASWRVGDFVLKRVDLSEAELEWQAAVFASILCDGFRVSHPRRARDGSLVVAGWCAWEAVEGRHEPRRWPEVIVAGEAFHAALGRIPRPDFLDLRTDPWAIGDRVAWGELPAEPFGSVKHLPRLLSALRPIEAPSQLIHGDLTGNVLFAERLPPALIDFSPYWRPAPFASAIVVADALVGEGADEAVLDAVARVEDFGQHLLRALIYRAVTDALIGQRERAGSDGADPYLVPVNLACELAGS
jgi:uncharacterized protein (TIGR02569 family)